MNEIIEYIGTLSGLITTLILFSIVFILYGAYQGREYKRRLENEDFVIDMNGTRKHQDASCDDVYLSTFFKDTKIKKEGK